ncbi:putative immunity protein [uncultured Pseudokineococcus sp.]|uniref:putative immunity protein n=1 Tax=uncultured Pseudokineococcus sp. TaxID=1642928 RepID=UPI00343808C6
MDEIRVVARFAAESAEVVLPVFEDARPDDFRPRAAVDAAWAFARGAARSNVQRVTAVDAHRAAKDTSVAAAQHAALAAGDAAAAAYLHPLAQATQVGHILGAAAHAARVSELRGGGDPDVGAASIRLARDRAVPTLVEVLRRYPVAPAGRGRVAQLMQALDASLRR